MEETLATGAIIARYRILSRLGVGGMGEVYLAEDMQLGRRVALKVLPAELTDKEERLQRLEQEARAASGLNQERCLVVRSRSSDEAIAAARF